MDKLPSLILKAIILYIIPISFCGVLFVLLATLIRGELQVVITNFGFAIMAITANLAFSWARGIEDDKVKKEHVTRLAELSFLGALIFLFASGINYAYISFREDFLKMKPIDRLADLKKLSFFSILLYKFLQLFAFMGIMVSLMFWVFPVYKLYKLLFNSVPETDWFKK